MFSFEAAFATSAKAPQNRDEEFTLPDGTHIPAKWMAPRNKVGSGLYSVVYKHPKDSDRVIKVYNEHANSRLSAYSQFLQDMVFNPAYAKYRRMMPKIYSINVLNNGVDYVVYVVMEKLQPLDISNSEGKYWEHHNKTRKLGQHPIIVDFKATHRVCEDLHIGNVMMRKYPSGFTQCVITDPFSDTGPTTIEVSTVDEYMNEASDGQISLGIGRGTIKLIDSAPC